MTILGSLVIHSDRPVSELTVPSLAGITQRTGHHVNSRYNGSYREHFDVEPLEVMVPQRYKRMTVLSTDGVRHDLAAELAVLDSKYENARQLFKLQRMLEQLPGAWQAVVNVSNTGAGGEAVSGAFYLLASGLPLYIELMFDSSTGSVQLVWSSFDIKAEVRESGNLNYSFVSLPVLRDRALFVPSQALCSKWWRMSQSFEAHRYGTLKASNALEVMLYKNPHI